MKRTVALVLSSMLLLGLAGCSEAASTQTKTEPVYVEKTLNLCVGDTYDFGAMGYTVENLEGTALYAVGDVVTASMVGGDQVILTDITFTQYRVQVTVYPDAGSLGDRFPLDKGMFQGKKIIAFGDSITDGCLLDPNTPTGFNYEDTYFAQLCRYLGSASDPTDLENCNFACGGTTMCYGTVGTPGRSGVERVDVTQPFMDAGRERNPYPNILDADLCVIYYGTNDLGYGIPAESDGSQTDTPTKPEDARTVRGGLYYMISRLRELNPRLKILVLPPIIRRAGGNLEYSADKTDVTVRPGGYSLRQYAAVMEQVCEENGALFLDWYPVFDYENFAQIGANAYSYDGLHPNVAGHEKMFAYLRSLIEQRGK